MIVVVHCYCCYCHLLVSLMCCVNIALGSTICDLCSWNTYLICIIRGFGTTVFAVGIVFFFFFFFFFRSSVLLFHDLYPNSLLQTMGRCQSPRFEDRAQETFDTLLVELRELREALNVSWKF